MKERNQERPATSQEKKKDQPPQAGETPPAAASRFCLHHWLSWVSNLPLLAHTAGWDLPVSMVTGLPWCLRWQRICLQRGRPEFNPWVRKIPWRRKWLPTPVFLPGKPQGHRSPEGYSPWSHMSQSLTINLSLYMHILLVLFLQSTLTNTVA